MNSTQILKKLGFSENEILIYITLFKKGELTISQLGAETKLHRQIIYRIIPQLEVDGIILKLTRSKKKLYSAISPKELFAIQKNKLNILEESIDELEKMQQKDHQEIQILKGVDGLRKVMEDMIDTCDKGDIFFRYSSRELDFPIAKYIPKKYSEKRDAKKLEQLVIVNSQLFRSNYKNRMECISKEIPNEIDPFLYNVSQVIYQDKVAIIDFEKETAIIIHNKNYADFQKAIFKSLYQKLK